MLLLFLLLLLLFFLELDGRYSIDGGGGRDRGGDVAADASSEGCAFGNGGEVKYEGSLWFSVEREGKRLLLFSKPTRVRSSFDVDRRLRGRIG